MLITANGHYVIIGQRYVARYGEDIAIDKFRVTRLSRIYEDIVFVNEETGEIKLVTASEMDTWLESGHLVALHD